MSVFLKKVKIKNVKRILKIGLVFANE